MFLSTLSDQVLTSKVESIVSSKDGLSNMIWVWGGLSLLSAILFPMIMAMLCSYSILGRTDSAATDFMKSNIELSIIENMRAWGKAFMWSFLLILPGIAKFILYTLTPYVVLFSKNYKTGKVDALEYSTLITKKHLKEVNWWLTVFYLFIPTALYVIGEPYRLISETPAKATILILIRTLSEYCFHYFMLKIFINFINENENLAAPETAAV